MENKKSFILYCDQKEMFEHLPPELCKELILHLFRYVNDENPTSENPILNALFAPIKHQLKRDLLKWEARAETSRENGKLGGRPKKEPKKPNGLKNNPEEPAKPVTVNVNATDNVNGNVNDKEKKINSTNTTAKITFSQEVISCVKNCLVYFDEHLQPKTAKEKTSWCKTVKILNERDNIPFEFIEILTKEIRQDEFWAKNFLSLNKLTKKNKEGVTYVVVFSEHIKAKKINHGRKKDGFGESSDERAIRLTREFAEKNGLNY